MKIPIYQVDAFTSQRFCGNPAAVCLLNDWPDDRHLQDIATENNLSETAFLVPNQDGYDLRWFTPLTEVALCGHATLASAYILFELLDWPAATICFQTRQSGKLLVTRKDGLLEMDFPARPPYPRKTPANLLEALGIEWANVLGSEEDLLVVLRQEKDVKAVIPEFGRLAQIDCRGIIVTATSEECDFVSRFFGPRVGVDEDPVTGSAHCVLAPYWANRLGKLRLFARQVSKRGGELFCEYKNERVTIAGKAVLYLEGSITI
jgi:PhzF family phenazine biosynthesis protein